MGQKRRKSVLVQKWDFWTHMDSMEGSEYSKWSYNRFANSIGHFRDDIKRKNVIFARFLVFVASPNFGHLRLPKLLKKSEKWVFWTYMDSIEGSECSKRPYNQFANSIWHFRVDIKRKSVIFAHFLVFVASPNISHLRLLISAIFWQSGPLCNYNVIYIFFIFSANLSKTWIYLLL